MIIHLLGLAPERWVAAPHKRAMRAWGTRIIIIHLLGRPPVGWLAASEISPNADRAWSPILQSTTPPLVLNSPLCWDSSVVPTARVGREGFLQRRQTALRSVACVKRAFRSGFQPCSDDFSWSCLDGREIWSPSFHALGTASRK
jgi:hypothetical protein